MSKRKLLLADDSITIQKVVNLTFADEGIEVTSVGDGDSAMQKFDEFMPDLVMADVNMPGLNGYEICHLIKNNEETRHIPVILLVGSFEPFDEAEATRVGADDFLTKPFQSIRQLVNKVTELLDRHEVIPDTIQNETETAPVVDSFDDTLKPEDKSEIPNEFGDAGMDDEMIETTPANKFASEPNQIFPSEPSNDLAQTQPLSADDWKGFDIVAPEESETQTAEESVQTDEIAEEQPEEIESAETSETELPIEESNVIDSESSEESEIEPEETTLSEPEYYSPADEESFRAEPEKFENSEAEIAEIAEPPIFDDAMTRPTDEFKFADSGETETKIEDESEIKKTEDSHTENQPEELTESETQTVDEPKVEEPETVQNTSTETEQPISAQSNIPEISFDDGDLLELPPLVEETGIRPQAFVQEAKPEPPPEIEPEPEKAPEAEAQIEAKDEPATVAEHALIQSFPPELIEAIAQKIADRFSDKMISDIAWEVVPQVTETIIKKMAEEKMKE